MVEKKRSTHPDWEKINAHVITPEEYDEIPEWTKADFERATMMIGGRIVSKPEFRAAWSKAVRIGRPPLEYPKQAVNIRLDADVLAHFRGLGAGWQTRINAILRKAARLPATKRRV